MVIDEKERQIAVGNVMLYNLIEGWTVGGWCNAWPGMRIRGEAACIGELRCWPL